ncbi:hypothetical protein NZD89_20775 [Alicyclobacillus fastidiosus]|uniref:Uncharacterized protein n=1 Tax=Alicyclobacillus fastidiosus TaxID=392011 RepID=A0ABY6ZCX6_9BACL|nr:hypothetical protein [Alicyclobacillus fastidiosus]WAH40711.1 hypothetical protein NZD89_20775 [Alicyclobacillus fastidiosus]GMA62182.1 hypothetical protein GCM10025859_26220 [Alicyclobacillus fastidiosus]
MKKYSEEMALQAANKFSELIYRHSEIIELMVEAEAWDFVRNGIPFDWQVSYEDFKSLVYCNFDNSRLELKIVQDDLVLCIPELNFEHVLGGESTFLKEVFKWSLTMGFSPSVKFVGARSSEEDGKVAFMLTAQLFDHVPENLSSVPTWQRNNDKQNLM